MTDVQASIHVLPENMQCPHCTISFHIPDHSRMVSWVGGDVYCWWNAQVNCPDCGKIIVWLITSEDQGRHFGHRYPVGKTELLMVWPKSTGRSPVPPEVPDEFSKDYREACLILSDSPNASAALSRRCLQHILNEKASVRSRSNLANAIGEVIDDPSVPSDISGALDDARNIGNFAAHPNKSTSTGQIIDVEEGEAEWCLNVIEILFDFYFVKPEDIKRRRAAFDQKLSDAGKSSIQRT